MLVMQGAQRHDAPPYDFTADARAMVNRVAPESSLEDVSVAATFDVEGQLHAVLRVRLAGNIIYLFARDAPPGFSRRTDLPPHVAYRLHLGIVLRQEVMMQDLVKQSIDDHRKSLEGLA